MIDMRTYSRPAYLPGFLVKFMGVLACGLA
jgi:hypothetical protein